MTVFTATLSQTAFLFLFIVLGYVLSKGKFVADNAHSVLSKLENLVFIPALILGTFIANFTPQKLSVTWKLLAFSTGLCLLAIGLSLLCARFCSKDRYVRKIYTYGLSFSNFSFMGNAIVGALFPEIFLEYIIFTIPIWTLIYLWGAPALLMGNDAKQTLAQRLKSLVNPMFVCTLLGMVIGVAGIPIPAFVSSAISSAGSCMSPLAMLLTGMTVAQFNLKEILTVKSVYLVSFLRLIAYPLIFIAAAALVPMDKTFAVCGLCSVAMPLGLNTIIVPSAYGKDTRVASGMALVSHILACITIPLILMLFQYVISQ